MVVREEQRREIILPEPLFREARKIAPLSSGAYFDAKHETTHSARTTRATHTSSWNKAHVTPSQVRRIEHDKPVVISVHADMLKIRRPVELSGKIEPDHTFSGGGIRGNITGFSRASRKRLIEAMASVRNTGAMLFLTMTFDDSVIRAGNEDFTANFEAFRRRFERQYPTWSAFWRKEWQDRKSGDFVGLMVPHFHLIIFTGVHYEKKEHEEVCAMFREWGAQVWQEITKSDDEAHLIYGFDVSPVRNRRHALSYVSKYVAKLEIHNFSGGRAWGRIGHIDTSASEKIPLSNDEYIILRRLIKRWMKTKGLALPPDATPEQIARFKCQRKKQTRYAKRYARQSFLKGCSIFGLGDTSQDGTPVGTFDGYWQFIAEAKRQAHERWLIEREVNN